MKHTFIALFIACWYNVFSQDYVTKNINSSYDEQTPILSPDGEYMYFTIAHNENNIGGTKDKGDIWYSIWRDSLWSAPLHGGTVLNNEGWNGIIGFGINGGMYLHHHYQDKKQGISIATKKNDNWLKPKSIGVPYFMNKSIQQSGSISPDGKVMLLSLESYGTIGAEDIYVLFKDGDRWTEPKSIGSVINTRFQEMTPMIAEDNKTIFYSSNGLNGKGSMDIYKTIRQDDTWLNWSKPTNMAEVNTEARELSFNVDQNKKMSWLVSTKDSDGYGDIRFFSSEQLFEDEVIVIETDSIKKEIETDSIASVDFKNEIIVKGSVYNAMDSTSIIASLEFVPQGKDTVISVKNNIAGNYRVVLPQNTYELKVSASNYLPHLESIELLDSANTTITNDFWLTEVKVGEAVKLDHVLFERGTATMLPTSYPDLDAVVEMLFDNPQMEIELTGHTDNQGSSKLNFKLSEERVEVVIKYLTDKKIAGKRVSGKGYGGSRPIASNTNPETRKLNRRVEFTIIKN